MQPAVWFCEDIIIDEIHALVGNKRGDLLSLSLAALRKLAPACCNIGLSATMARPNDMRPWLSEETEKVEIMKPCLSKKITIDILDS